jgi:hypothetical protein
VCLDLLEKARSIRPCGRILRLGSAGRVKTAACGWARRACRRVKTKGRSPSALFTDHKGTNTSTDPSANEKAVNRASVSALRERLKERKPSQISSDAGE